MNRNRNRKFLRRFYGFVSDLRFSALCSVGFFGFSIATTDWFPKRRIKTKLLPRWVDASLVEFQKNQFHLGIELF
jgi:hypothetical protein